MDGVISLCSCPVTVYNERTALDYWNESSDLELQSCKNNNSQECFGHILSSSCNEQMLDSAFQMWDTGGRGEVSAQQIIEYLQSVKDPSSDGYQLQCLSNMLDPEKQGILLDLKAFRTVMSKWITNCCLDRVPNTEVEDEKSMNNINTLQSEVKDFSCDSQLEGYGGDIQVFMGEHADIRNKVKELNLANKTLIDQKTKLQKSLELAEETNAHLTEELIIVKNKLKSSQQAVHHSRSLNNELEDMKSFAKSLEEEVCILRSEKKHMKKETRSLISQAQILQDENEKLLFDKEQSKRSIHELSAENSMFMHQLYEFESALLQKDMLLTEKSLQVEELMSIVEERKHIIKELKIEKKCLQEQLQQTHEDIAMYPGDSYHKLYWKLTTMTVPSVCIEIEQMQKLGCNLISGLSSPLCGITRTSDSSLLSLIQDPNIELTYDHFWAMTEQLLTQLNEETETLISQLQQISCASVLISDDSERLKCQLEELSCILLQRLSCLLQLNSVRKTHSSKLNEVLQKSLKKEHCLHLRTRTNKLAVEWSLLPVSNQLVPVQRNDQMYPRYKFFCRAVTWFCAGLKCPLELIWMLIERHGFLRLLMIFVFGTFTLYRVWSGENIWTTMKEIVWPHLQLHYRALPPL